MEWVSSSRLRGAAVLVAAAPLLAGCGDALSPADAGEGPRVVASHYPLEYVAARVTGTHGEVIGLTEPGVEPHDLELTVQQVAEVAEADLAVHTHGFQPAVDEAIDQQRPEYVLDTAEVVPLELSGEHTEDDGHDHEGEGDPHFWLDPERLARVAGALTEQLVEIDPEHAADYRSNLAALEADLDALDDDYARGLAQCERNTVVVSHDAFGYLEKYGVEFESIAGLSPDAEPSPAHLAELATLARAEGITTVFSETLASPALARTLAGELDISTAVLDPIEGLADETSEEDYLSLMRSNLAALQKANDCR